MLPQFGYSRPSTLPQALELLASHEARVHAGGTDLLGCLRDRSLSPPELVVSLSHIGELRGIRRGADGSVRIGAMTRVAEIASDSALHDSHRAVVDAASEVASPQLRNQGTIGGNLCQKPRCWYYRGDFPCLRKGGDTCFAVDGDNRYHCIFGGEMCYYVHPSDLAPALVALGAVVRLVSAAGSRTIPVEKLYVAPGEDPTRETTLEAGEIVAEIVLPPTAATSSYRKVRVRGAWDFALAGVALAVERAGGTVSRAAVVLSGVAPIPWRARTAEAALRGATIGPETAARAAAAAVAEAEPLTHNGYKVPLLQGLIAEQVERLVDRTPTA